MSWFDYSALVERLSSIDGRFECAWIYLFFGLIVCSPVVFVVYFFVQTCTVGTSLNRVVAAGPSCSRRIIQVVCIPQAAH